MIVPASPAANDIHAALDRMEASFGAAAIHELLEQFDSQLFEASSALDARTAVSTAHRIAGIAGTLGFVELGRVWARIAEGHESAIEEARRLGAVAHAVIAERTDKHASPPTSV